MHRFLRHVGATMIALPMLTGCVDTLGPQVVMAPLGAKLVLGPGRSDEARAVLLHETIDEGGCPWCAFTQVVAHGSEDVVLCREEHVVQPHLQAATFWFRRQHGASVVGHDQANGLPVSSLR